jgi:hypothetical protein
MWKDVVGLYVHILLLDKFCPGIQEILERICYRNEQQQIVKKMFKYVSCGQRNVGRPARRWIETVTDQ